MEKSILLLQKAVQNFSVRFYCRNNPCYKVEKRGLIIGVYRTFEDPNNPGKLTPTGEKYDKQVKGQVYSILTNIAPPPELGQSRILYNIDPNPWTAVAIVGLGRECLGYDSFEQMDEGKEAIRIAASTGAQTLQALNFPFIDIETFGHAESAAEGAAMGVWLYQEKKNIKNRIQIPHLEMHDDCDWIGWQIGLQKAAAQNYARQLADTPSNLMTPSSFAQNAVEVLCNSGINVEVKVKGWIESQKMCAFLHAAKGSCEPPIFLELSYYGAPRDERPIVIIGKGLTYNCGGLHLLSCEEQAHMRGDMSGAACVVAAIRAVAGLQLPLNVRALIPLCENMPGCSAMRPGDVTRAMNGKSVVITTTDCCGRLMLADTLVYAESFWPRFIIDVGTMTYDMMHSVGTSCSGVFTNSEPLWEYMLAASMHTGDRVWRFPLWDHFRKLTRSSSSVDIKSTDCSSSRKCGMGCFTAAYLNEFVPCGDWLHLDTRSVMVSNGSDIKYLRRGMSGRPTRTLVEFLSQLVCNRD